MEDILRHLSETLFFHQLGHDELCALADCGSRFNAPANVEIIRQGEEGDALYLVLDGGVKVTTSADGGEFVVARLGKNFVFLVDGDHAARREVTLGTSVDGLVELLTGVKEGEILVVKGQELLDDGVKVKVVK